jgi:hypothetical protein
MKCMRKHPTPQITRQLIAQEKEAVAKSTEDRVAAMQKEANDRTRTSYYVLLPFCLCVLVLYTILTFFKKCKCTITLNSEA